MSMLMPKKVKHRKWWKGRHRTSVATRGTTLSYGQFGLQVAHGDAWLTSRQIEAARRTMTRYIKRRGKVWIRVFPDKPVTSKGTEMPMGGGKGAVDHFTVPIYPGRILFEIDGVPENVAKEAIRRAGYKLPVKTKFISR